MLISLTVFFEDPFWVGVFELKEDSSLKVCRVVFGSEPKDYEISEYILNKYYKLSFSESVDADPVKPGIAGIKKLKRQAAREISRQGVSTKSQEALRIQMESKKTEKIKKSKAMLQEEKQIRFLQSQQKKKQKKRGH